MSQFDGSLDDPTHLAEAAVWIEGLRSARIQANPFIRSSGQTQMFGSTRHLQIVHVPFAKKRWDEIEQVLANAPWVDHESQFAYKMFPDEKLFFAVNHTRECWHEISAFIREYIQPSKPGEPSLSEFDYVIEAGEFLTGAPSTASSRWPSSPIERANQLIGSTRHLRRVHFPFDETRWDEIEQMLATAPWVDHESQCAYQMFPDEELNFAINQSRECWEQVSGFIREYILPSKPDEPSLIMFDYAIAGEEFFSQREKS